MQMGLGGPALCLVQSPLVMAGGLLGLRLLQVVEPVMRTPGRAEWLLIHDSFFSVM